MSSLTAKNMHFLIASFLPFIIATDNDERYEKMSSKLEAEQSELIVVLDALEMEIAEQNEQANGVDCFLETVKRYTEIEMLTPAIVHEFICKIIIHEPE